MKLTWLGQAGWLLRTRRGTRVMIDPYLSDSLRQQKGEAFRRRTPLRPELLSTQLDALVITHSHADHLDWGTLRPLLAAQEKPLYVLGPRSVWEALREDDPRHNELVLFQEGTRYTVEDVHLAAVFAAHSDPCAIGVTAQAEGLRVYHTGDTLYHRDLISPDTAGADALLLPINGRRNNMNAADAALLTRALSPRLAVPMHWDMFAAMGCDPAAYRDPLVGDGVDVRVLAPYEELTL